jgi:hypothetical protein
MNFTPMDRRLTAKVKDMRPEQVEPGKPAAHDEVLTATARCPPTFARGTGRT